MLEREIFDLIENVSHAERKGMFVRTLVDGMHSEFAGPLSLRAIGDFRREGSRYELGYARGDEVWNLLEGGFTFRTFQRRLAGELWYIQRGLRPKAEGRDEWYDLILIPIDRELRHVLGLMVNSMAGEEGQEREATFHILARLIRLAVDRHHQSQRLQEILALARDQQVSLLQPELPELPGYQVSRLAVPALEVGGDYHQLIPLTSHRFAAVVADAKGKGFEAAVQVTALHAALRVVSAMPFEVVHKVRLMNRALAEQGDLRNLVSMFYAELDEVGWLMYVNCSHPAAIIVRPNSVEELSAGGIFLGLDPSSEYRTGICELGSGDLLIAYTDGWSEAFNERSEEFGAERLREVVRGLHGWEPESVIRRIQEACDAFLGDTPLQDDRSLVVFRRN
jgi:serine phosphatase RsbU (regulator of sigma subunit)